MKYKTVREAQKPLVIIPLIIGIFAVCILILMLLTGKDDGLVPLVVSAIVLGIGSFVYCWSGPSIRKRYYKKGKRYDAVIVGAEWLLNGRGEDTFYLIIRFYDESKGILYRKTNGYVGSPNVKLKSVNCSVYEWKGKYMEGDFQTVEKGSKGCLDIPVSKYKQLQTKGKGYV